MRHNILFAIAVLPLIAGCSKENDAAESVTESEKTFLASNEAIGANGTKTFLTAAHRVWWQKDDAISLFAAGSNSKLEVTSIKYGGAQAEFSGLAPGADTYYALYPYQADATFSDGTFSLTLPSEQKVISSSFDSSAALAVCQSNTNALHFRNVGAVISVMTGNQDVCAVKLTGYGASLSGSASVSFNGDALAVGVNEGVDYVQLRGDFEPNTPYYFVVLPGSYSGFNLQFTRSDGKTINARTNVGANISSNSFFTLGTFTFSDQEWENGVIKELDSYVLNGAEQVQAFIDDKVDQRINVQDLIITGADVTFSQLLALKHKVLSVRGTFRLDGVLADEWNSEPEDKKTLYLNTEQIFYNSSNDGQNGIHLYGSIILENIPCYINPNGLSGVSVCGGDLILRNISWPFSWDGQKNITMIRGDLVLDHITHTLANFNFPKLATVGGSLVINDCDNSFWDIKGMADNFTVNGDLVLTDNSSAFTYPDWRTGFYKFAKIGGNVTIKDNAMSNKEANYCFVRDLAERGVISDTAVVTIGSSESGLLDFDNVKSCSEYE